MDRRVGLQLCLAAMVFLASCAAVRPGSHPLPEKLSVRVWPSEATRGPAPGEFRYPETTLLPELRNRDNLGIAISGGGTRSATAALGEFRALQSLGLLSRTRYISCVSGGSWFAMAYAFGRPEIAPARADDPQGPRLRGMPQHEYDRLLLGKYVAPENLRAPDLTTVPEGSFARAVTRINFSASGWFAMAGNENYARVIGDTFLRPFGLGDPDKSFTWSRRYFDRAIAPFAPGLAPAHFYFCAPDRPYLIVNEALILPQHWSLMHRVGQGLRELWRKPVPDDRSAWLVESTPLYTGLKPLAQPLHPGRMHDEKIAGGGFVETHGYGMRFVGWDDSCPGRERAFVQPEKSCWPGYCSIYSLADASASSSAAAGAALGPLATPFGARPRFNHWPPSADDPLHQQQRYPHVDAGTCDNSAVIPLLARRVPRIIVLLNSARPFRREKVKGEPGIADLPTEFTALFGRTGTMRVFNAIGQPAANRVLDAALPDGRDALEDMAAALLRKNRRGEPLVHCQTCVTVANPRHGVPGGDRVRICWVYFAPARLGNGVHQPGNLAAGSLLQKWIERLPDDPRRDGAPGLRAMFTDPEQIREHRLERFPAYRLLRENRHWQQLTPVQTNALAHYAGFTIMEAEEEIRRGLGL